MILGQKTERILNREETINTVEYHKDKKDKILQNVIDNDPNTKVEYKPKTAAEWKESILKKRKYKKYKNNENLISKKTKKFAKANSFDDSKFRKLKFKNPPKNNLIYYETDININHKKRLDVKILDDLNLSHIVSLENNLSEDKNEDQVNEDLFITLRDYDNLPFAEKMQYDKRRFWVYFWDSLKSETKILSLFYKRSLLYPTNIRILRVFSFMSFMVGINAVLYKDDDIRDRMNLETQKGVSKQYLI